MSAAAGVRGWRLVRVAGPDGQARCGVIDPAAPDAIRLLGHDDWLGALEDGDLAALADEAREHGRASTTRRRSSRRRAGAC